MLFTFPPSASETASSIAEIPEIVQILLAVLIHVRMGWPQRHLVAMDLGDLSGQFRVFDKLRHAAHQRGHGRYDHVIKQRLVRRDVGYCIRHSLADFCLQCGIAKGRRERWQRQGLESARTEDGGGQAVDLDLSPLQVDAQGADEADHTGLGSRVEGRSGERVEAGVGGGADDQAP